MSSFSMGRVIKIRKIKQLNCPIHRGKKNVKQKLSTTWHKPTSKGGVDLLIALSQGSS